MSVEYIWKAQRVTCWNLPETLAALQLAGGEVKHVWNYGTEAIILWVERK